MVKVLKMNEEEKSQTHPEKKDLLFSKEKQKLNYHKEPWNFEENGTASLKYLKETKVSLEFQFLEKDSSDTNIKSGYFYTEERSRICHHKNFTARNYKGSF